MVHNFLSAASVFENIDVAGSLTKLVGDFTGMIGEAAPVLVGATLAVAGVTLGLKYVKKLTGKIG